jgi:5-methylcytosine-specific restriction protein B
MSPFIEEASNLLRYKKNIILQGAPGTGKTYNTAALALAIIDGIVPDNHTAVMKRYEELLEDRIFFTTFHQSLDYEDFVEGLKPHVQTNSEGENIGITYETEDGIFKRACQAVITDEDMNIIECIDDYLQKIKGVENRRIIPSLTGKTSFYAWWKEGNKTISTRSTSSTSPHGIDYSPAPLNIDKVKLQAIGRGTENNWQQYAQAFINAVKQEYQANTDKPVVIIIDEINRGNISKIFGELITLLESDKRDNSTHPIKVTLPYSKTLFGVPKNLYIIGTMNTTDRSTGTIDYALRRRFAFITLPADAELIENESAKAIFNDVKTFIEQHQCTDMDIDDLMVGHSYFMASNDTELKQKIRYEVIPLIKEYIKDGILSIHPDEAQKWFAAWNELKTNTEAETDDSEV